MKRHALATVLACILPATAGAVYLNADGTGQALIYPYYTAQSVSGNPFNTYISVVNHAADAKALRVRFREGRNGAEVGSFNLFLAPNDVWTGAVIPAGVGTVLVTTDTSCVQGRFAVDFSAPPAAPTLGFGNAFYTGANGDGAGDGLDRTREGYAEILEMATLTGNSAAAIAHNTAGLPTNCAAIASLPAADVAAPTGGLSGTLTLINVANGMDFTVNAEALAQLSTQAYYRPAADPYPGFAAAEITATSAVTDDGVVYLSRWQRGVDAVSAVFMRSHWAAEIILDPGTRSATDFVLTFPTRLHYVTPQAAAAPFRRPAAWAPRCGTNGEEFEGTYFNRAQESAETYFTFPPITDPLYRLLACAAANVFTPRKDLTAANNETSPVLGSIHHDLIAILAAPYVNGWIDVRRLSDFQAPTLTSLPSSTRIQRDGSVVQGSHTLNGLPMSGFSVRTFENGTLTCGTARCQGNYGGAFPLRFTRSITPAS